MATRAGAGPSARVRLLDPELDAVFAPALAAGHIDLRAVAALAAPLAERDPSHLIALQDRLVTELTAGRIETPAELIVTDDELLEGILAVVEAGSQNAMPDTRHRDVATELDWVRSLARAASGGADGDAEFDAARSRLFRICGSG